ncbi:MAG: hypothetical protein HY815_12615 [Candidatus Riflebacteria bacterium]|nr:hypothetical protein [Candidatus Riflebacteria bacterium]
MKRHSNQVISVLVLVLAFTLNATAADSRWIGFDKGSDRQPAVRAAGLQEEITIDIDVPGIRIGAQEGYSTVVIPDNPASMIPGNPELPLISASLVLPDRGTPQVRLEVVAQTTVKLTTKVIPSRGHVKRNVALTSVPLVEGPTYKKDAFYPESFSATISAPYIFRDIRGAAVRISPTCYNPVTNELKVLKKARLHVKIAQGLTGVNEKTRKSPAMDLDFAPVYRKVFANFQSAASTLGQPSENAGRAIILCPDKWVANLAPLTEWRAVKGLATTLVKTSEIATGAITAEQVKTFIKGEYDKGGLTYILLVGDADTMPTLTGENEQADSDACYVKLEGDDHVPDVFISRFSAKTDAEIDVQVARAVSYEKNPVIGEAAAFYKKATGIASDEGNPTDFARCNELRDALLAFRYTEVDQIYDPGANKTKVAEAVNAGRGLINYIGHGSKNMWVTSSFNTSDAKALTNGAGMWPMVWSVACVNGDFVSGSDCFCEGWAKSGTKADPKGAVGMVGASTNMSWVPPCVWQKAIVTQFIVPEVAFTGGALHYLGLLKAFEEYGTETSSEGTMLAEQCIFFGDCSVVLRNDIPKEAKLTVESLTNRELTLKVVSGDKAVKGARVVVLMDAAAALVGISGDDGLVKVTLPEGRAKALLVTVTGPNLIPIIKQEVALPTR